MHRSDTHIISRLRFYISPQTNTGIDTSIIAPHLEIPNMRHSLYLLQGTGEIFTAIIATRQYPPNSRLFLACKKKIAGFTGNNPEKPYISAQPLLFLYFLPQLKRDLMLVALAKNIIISRTCECLLSNNRYINSLHIHSTTISMSIVGPALLYLKFFYATLTLTETADIASHYVLPLSRPSGLAKRRSGVQAHRG